MAVVPVLPTIPSGGVYTSSQVSQIVAAVSFAMNPPIATLRQTVLQSVLASTFTAITFDVEDVDRDPSGAGGHSTSVNTSRFTAVYPGYYDLSGGIGWAANATGRRLSAWYINGNPLNGTQAAMITHATFDGEWPTRNVQEYLNFGDYVELMGYQESGSPLNTYVTGAGQSHMKVRWVSN